MENIGLITFHAAHNCGSIMQAFALQTKVKQLGYNCEIIDFSNKGQKELYEIFSKRKTLKKYVRNLVLYPHKRRLKLHFKNYEDFIRKNLILSSKKYEEYKELESEKFNYDTFVCGSDQIWNVTIKDYDDAYFLPFVKDKPKIAYAPSFGAKNIEKHVQDIDKYRKYLNDFNFLSVREQNGQKWINNITGKTVQVILDPTLLINREIYDKLERTSNIIDDYIFYYAPNYKKDIDKFVKEISKKYNLKVIAWNTKDYILKGLKYKGFELAKEQDPGIYLNLIKNAKIVITTSFHGTIFSSIYRKNFWTIKNGNMYSDDDRVITLINQLGLTERLIEPKFDDKWDYFQKVDYTKYNNNIDGLKKQSLEYLELALKGKNNEK
ncbi:MAG: polysaccharide pyruvyl transferase family protein [Lachnospiraceae bacterium]|jgi:hypothetical protein|nr:polysaccharide pyruvyl transferase family protein [Lachnospiraceae bacterium]